MKNTNKAKRIGPQMERAVEIVRANPGCCILDVAKRLHVGARTGSNNALGYNPVHRAIAAGLIKCGPNLRKGAYALYAYQTVQDMDAFAEVFSGAVLAGGG